jgi:hypothetical protein
LDFVIFIGGKWQSSNFRTFSDLKNGKVQISKLFPNISELFIRNSEFYSESPATGKEPDNFYWRKKLGKLNFIIFNGGKRCGKLDFVIFDGEKFGK